ncbi:MAG: hypothetical protein WBD27_15455 [Pyrinomonadaceae bacterium]
MQNEQLSLKEKAANSRRGEEGFSVFEIIVAMVLFLGVTAAIWGLMRVALLGREATSQNVQLTKSVRLGLNLVGRDTYNAGLGYPVSSTVVLPDNRISNLLGIPVDVDTSRDTVPPIITGNNITLNTFNTVAGVRTDQVTFLFKDTLFNLVGNAGPPVDRRVPQPLSINAATTTAGIDEIVPISGSNSVCRINDIYLITGNTGSTIGLATALSGADKVQFSNGDALGLNQTGATGPLSGITTPASMQRIQMVTYFVTADGTLTRRQYANVPPAVPVVGWIDEPLVYGVENFQIQYVMNDGTLSDNPSAGPDAIAGNGDDVQANLAEVRQIRYTISVRSIEMGADNRPYSETMTSTFSTRNLGYEAN